MNYAQTIAAIRAEIERLEAEHGPVRAYPITIHLLEAWTSLSAARAAEESAKGGISLVECSE